MKKVTVSSLSKAYRNVRVLEDINLVFKSNAIHEIIGKNGAGKSTLLQCIAGLTRYGGVVKREGIHRIGQIGRAHV